MINKKKFTLKFINFYHDVFFSVGRPSAQKGQIYYFYEILLTRGIHGMKPSVNLRVVKQQYGGSPFIDNYA